MKASYHSVHQPSCSVCRKHCKSFESLREHTNGPIAKGDCSRIFAERGCGLCMRIFDSPAVLEEHRYTCCLPAPVPLGSMKKPYSESLIYDPPPNNENVDFGHSEAVALECEMVGCGSDGSLDVCARVCLVDEHEKPIFHTYVLPQIPVTDYRYEITGITEDHLREAMLLEEVRGKILDILYNGESIGILRLHGGKGRVLVGHGLDHDLDRLKMHYPDLLIRDTAKYPPLMKTNLVSHSLKYLVKTYLGQVFLIPRLSLVCRSILQMP
ncbi:Exonuclease family protein [Striga hermonthica]|uniref:Exonuclease family protein n=1 Tax=Striga hermonthica TaxID=68872 RepID=A0A9N7NG55_STRHE|nr:Exonuclease family protein [Striga hermonthica]